MTRDMDFVRNILLTIEGRNTPTSLGDLLGDNASQADYEKTAEHLRLLIDEAGLLSGTPVHTLAGKNWINIHLTWEGHDFLDSVRDERTWAKTKTGALAAGGWTLDILKDLAKGFVKKQIEEQTGIKL